MGPVKETLFGQREDFNGHLYVLNGGLSFSLARPTIMDYLRYVPGSSQWRNFGLTMRGLAILGLTVAALGLAIRASVPPREAQAIRGPMPQTKRVPVIVELFTSEGCSSCPPADELLSRLDREQPVPGVEVIPLEEHVDYWDGLGWRDPFSSHAMTTRQSDYGRQLHVADIYTPQAVVGGQLQVLGSDARQLRDGIAQAAKSAKATVEVEFQSASIAKVKVDKIPSDAGLCDVMMAVTENKLESSVVGGENNGRRLAHTGVVRSLAALGRADSSSPAVFSMHLRFSPQWKRDNLRYVVFVQDRTTRKILGATAVTP